MPFSAGKRKNLNELKKGGKSVEALEAIRKRRSVRNYRQDVIKNELLEEIVDCGRLAATARNEQPWEFIVVTDKDKLKKIAEITDYGKFIAQAAACITVVCRETKYYLEDGSAAVQNILVAASALGIGSCWVAGDKKPYAKEIMSLLSVPEGYKLIALIPLGYPAEAPSPPKRKLSEVLHWEKF